MVKQFNIMVKHTSVLKILSDRYSTAKTIPGTRLFNQFIPLSRGGIAAKRVSEDIEYSVKFEFEHILTMSIGQFVLCSYEGHKLVGMAM